MSPQVQTAWLRGLVETLLIALATAGEAAVAHLLTGDNTRTVVIAALGVLCNTILTRVGEGKLDANRASKLAREIESGKPLTALRKSDVGHPYVTRAPRR